MPVKRKTKHIDLGRAIINNKNHTIIEKKRAIRAKNAENPGLVPEPGLTSVLDVNSLDDFLETTALAERSFEAEKGVAIIVDREAKEINLMDSSKYGQEYNTLQIPRRPKWRQGMTAEELDRNEKESFLEWRRNVAHQVENNDGSVAPFEKNIEVWRQLWRVLEMSDIVVQIVDARNPLLFRCPDLEVYTKEIDPIKKCILIVNKADLLTNQSRHNWGRYFESVNINYKFFSAKKASDNIVEEEREEEKKEKEEEEEQEEEEKIIEEEEKPVQKVKTLKALKNKFGVIYSDSEDDDDDDDDKKEEEEEEEEEEEDKKESNEISSEDQHAINALLEQDKLEENKNNNNKKEEIVNTTSEASNSDTSNKSVNNTTIIEENDLEDEVRPQDKIYNREEIMAYLEEEACKVYELLKEREMNKEQEVQEKKLEEINISTSNNNKEDIEDDDNNNAEDIEEDEEDEEEENNENNEEEDDEEEDDDENDEEEEDDDDDGVFTPYKFRERRAVVGMVGFPNVGKSSLINVLIGVCPQFHGVRVAVGPTPGKTKHFQTVILSDKLMLCDCPGLVFPVFMNTKEDLIFNGILPVSNLRDHISPIRLVCQRIPRSQLELVYHIRLPFNAEDPPNAAPSPRQLLKAYCTVRGYMASNHSGVDEPKGARNILKDVLMGTLLWTCPPPALGVVPDNSQDTIVIPTMSKDIDHLPSDILLDSMPELPTSSGGKYKPRDRTKKVKSEKKMRKLLKKGGVPTDGYQPHINGRKPVAF
ncbi:hypothetical protein WA158_003716 [Blastocystis sp. Blastoise]